MNLELVERKYRRNAAWYGLVRAPTARVPAVAAEERLAGTAYVARGVKVG